MYVLQEAYRLEKNMPSAGLGPPGTTTTSIFIIIKCSRY